MYNLELGLYRLRTLERMSFHSFAVPQVKVNLVVHQGRQMACQEKQCNSDFVNRGQSCVGVVSTKQDQHNSNQDWVCLSLSKEPRSGWEDRLMLFIPIALQALGCKLGLLVVFTSLC